MTLVLEHSIELNCRYDEDEDILYAWVGEKPRPAITYETDEGHLIRLDPETKQFVGVTILDYKERWADQPLDLHWEVEVEQRIPWVRFVARKRRRKVAEQRTLAPRQHAHLGV